jgi:mannose-1-phosphate guanylyltransferase
VDFYPVIPAGGSGKRLWPLSRADEPKFLMPVGPEGVSLLLQTVERLKHVAPVENTYVVTGERHADRIAAEAPELRRENIVAEPSPRDSGPAIALGAAIIAHRHPGSVMGSFAADHYIPDADVFADALRTAIAGAERDLLMTVGVEPTRPDTGYGYIHFDAGSAEGGVHAVSQFKEKPTQEVAQEFLDSGEYLWNASMFVWRPEVFLEELHGYDAALHDGVTELAAAWDTPGRAEALASIWPQLSKVAVEYVVMEPAAQRGRVGVARGRFAWTDVGDFNTLGEINAPDADGNAVLGASAADVLIRDGRNLVLHSSSGKLVAIVGAEDLAVIDTDDVLLICSRDRVQSVKDLVDSLTEHQHLL